MDKHVGTFLLGSMTSIAIMGLSNLNERRKRRNTMNLAKRYAEELFKVPFSPVCSLNDIMYIVSHDLELIISTSLINDNMMDYRKIIINVHEPTELYSHILRGIHHYGIENRMR